MQALTVCVVESVQLVILDSSFLLISKQNVKGSLMSKNNDSVIFLFMVFRLSIEQEITLEDNLTRFLTD